MYKLAISLFFLALTACQHKKVPLITEQDEYLWLEEIKGEKAINWAKEQNSKTFGVLKQDPRYKNLYEHFKDNLTKKDRLPFSSLLNETIYNFWTDDHHLKGILRTTTYPNYLKKTPHWKTLLDLDQLSLDEKKSWVYRGLVTMRPEYKQGLIFLSDGGKDALVLREFDIENKQFLTDGFKVNNEVKMRAIYFDKDHLLYGAANDPEGMTTSGYPLVFRKWKRGTDVFESPIYFKGETSDVSVWAVKDEDREDKLTILGRTLSFYKNKYFMERFGERVELDLPEDIIFMGIWKNFFLAKTRTAWTTSQGTFVPDMLLMIDLDQLQQNNFDKVKILFAPQQGETLTYVSNMYQDLLVGVQKNVAGQVWHYQMDGETIKKYKVPLPDFGNASIQFSDIKEKVAFLTFHNLTTPTSLYTYQQSNKKLKLIKQLPARFNAKNLVTEQFWATSADSTKVPYFVTYPKNMKHNGKNPTLLYAYGGFNVSLTPNYLNGLGKIWNEKGGVYVLGNIRGGGEFGNAWHQAAQKENRQKAFDDLIAISKDLIKRGITSPEKLGISGGSNGGLLVGTVATQRPDLFKAVICSVPLLDMMRFHKLLAGASWMDEYGNPDVAKDRDYLLKYSPYQNISSEKRYPKIFFKTSTMDDRVHPGHARKMVAKMQAQGHSVLYYENIEGGHGGAADWQQKAEQSALEFTYLYQQLFD